jgi:hypothetical protein
LKLYLKDSLFEVSGRDSSWNSIFSETEIIRPYTAHPPGPPASAVTRRKGKYRSVLSCTASPSSFFKLDEEIVGTV